MDNAVNALQACGSRIVPSDGTPPVNLPELLFNLEEAAFHIKWAKIFLDQDNRQSAKALDYCLYFLEELDGYEVPEVDALTLAGWVMKAHGFSNEELEVFKYAKRSQRNRNAPKRRHAVYSRYSALIEKLFELRKEHGLEGSVRTPERRLNPRRKRLPGKG